MDACQITVRGSNSFKLLELVGCHSFYCFLVNDIFWAQKQTNLSTTRALTAAVIDLDKCPNLKYTSTDIFQNNDIYKWTIFSNNSQMCRCIIRKCFCKLMEIKQKKLPCYIDIPTHFLYDYNQVIIVFLERY